MASTRFPRGRKRNTCPGCGKKYGIANCPSSFLTAIPLGWLGLARRKDLKWSPKHPLVLEWQCDCGQRLALGAAPIRPASQLQMALLWAWMLFTIWLVTRADHSAKTDAVAVALAVLVGIVGLVWTINTFVPWVESADVNKVSN